MKNKFRTWDTFNKEEPKMIYFDFWKLLGGTVYPDMDTVMQFTGILDMNEKEIFEGDIVLMDIGDVQNNKTLKITDEQRKEVYKRDTKIISYQKGSFGFYPAFPDLNYIDDREWCPLLNLDGELWTEYMKVIGNIYENPELIK
jgi:uncharacterized phage protein (TIGR01671 family)